MEKHLYDNYVTILQHELVSALGCTEPIAVAYCAAIAGKVLGSVPEEVSVYCSGNIIKNVKSVTVPNSGGMKGIEAAAMLGILGGDADKKLEVLQSVTEEDRKKTTEYLASGACKVFLQEGEENLYVRCELLSNGESVLVELKTNHDHISRIEKNGEILFEQKDIVTSAVGDKFLMNLSGIYEFACTCALEDIQSIVQSQLTLNMNLAKEGLASAWGVNVGGRYLEYAGNSTRTRALAMAAAGSDARMSGCSLPAVINSGSGNQGITVSMPIAVYAEDLNVSEEQKLRALVLGNLVAIHQKKYIGNLSCYCGATSAAVGAACGIAFLRGDSFKVICDMMTNAIATIGGMICDGAKASCAGKIRSALDTVLFALDQAEHGECYAAGDGIVGENTEQTIQNIGRVARVGMGPTDIEVLHIMTAG